MKEVDVEIQCMHFIPEVQVNTPTFCFGRRHFSLLDNSEQHEHIHGFSYLLQLLSSCCALTDHACCLIGPCQRCMDSSNGVLNLCQNGKFQERHLTSQDPHPGLFCLFVCLYYALRVVWVQPCHKFMKQKYDG